MTSESGTTIMTVSDLIDSAFGDPDVNVVHHKHLQTILYLIARQLRVLERRVAVYIGPGIRMSSSSLSVTEVQVHAMSKKKKEHTSSSTDIEPGKSHPGKTGKRPSQSKRDSASGLQDAERPTVAKSPKLGTASAKEKTSPDKTTTDKTKSSKTTSDKTYTEKSSSDKTSTDKTSTDKTSTDKTSTEKISTDRTSSDRTSTDLTSTDKTSSDKTSSSKIKSDKTSTEKDFIDKTSTDIKSSTKKSDKFSTEPASSDITSTDKTLASKSTTDKTSVKPTSSDITSTDKTLASKSTTDKTSVKPTSSDITSTDKTSAKQASSDITSTDKTTEKMSTAQTPIDKTSTEKASSDKTSTVKSSSDKKSADKYSSDMASTDKTSKGKGTSVQASSDKKSTKEKSSEKQSGTTSARSKGPQDYQKLLEEVEMLRERELRIIHQRADSREEHDKTPTPIASLDSVEATYEKLLVVERVPVEEAKARAARERSTTRKTGSGPRLSLVTQEQFEELESKVHQLQEKFGPVSIPGFPENAQLMHDLRKGASLTDAMAALQLSARLEATEKTLQNMLSLVTDLASQTPGIDLTDTDDIQVLFGASESKKSKSAKHSPASIKKGIVVESSLGVSPSMTSAVVSHIDVPLVTEAPADDEKDKKNRVTYEELENALEEIYDKIMKQVNVVNTRSIGNAENAFKLANRLELKIDASLNIGNKMENLETLVSNYAEQINVLDTGLSSQMTNYQEELTQMQHDLETGLETMAEALANIGGDATAVAELNGHFSDLQGDIENTLLKQKLLRDNQNSLSVDLNALRREIELLRETKSDREEVVDALRDKAGLGALNGLVSRQQFDAVRGDIEKRIGTAYDKFNNQEIVWQKAIDDLLREMNEKADLIQVEGLRDEINRYLEHFRAKLKFIMDIVGEPVAAALSRKVHRDTACLSCAAPAHMKLEESALPILPALRPAAIGAEALKPGEDGDHGGVCFQGYPIPHPRDPRSHICNRWCGGSHTVVTNAISRVPPSMIITPATRKVAQELGTDGKMYAVDEPQPRLPCLQCNMPKPSPEASVKHASHSHIYDGQSDMVPCDYRQTLTSAFLEIDLVSVTPPPIFETD